METIYMLNNKFLNNKRESTNISLDFITQSYFAVPKYIKLNSTHSFVVKIPNKRELQQNAFNPSSDIDFREFMNFYKKCSENHIHF